MVSPFSHTSVTLRHIRLSVVILCVIILVNMISIMVKGPGLMEQESVDDNGSGGLSWRSWRFDITNNPKCSTQHPARHTHCTAGNNQVNTYCNAFASLFRFEP